MFRKAPTTRRTPKASRSLFILVAVLVFLESAAFGGTYLLDTRHYVSTDNAQVDGDQMQINAPASGTVSHWSIEQGQSVERDQVVGRIRLVGSGPQVERPVRSPGVGMVAVDEVTDGSYVNAGAHLATAYNPSSIYVTARVEDTDISEVHQGAAADISVDAYPKAAITGIVTSIEGSAASNFTYLPPPGTADPSDPHRVDQYIPVRITLTSTGGAQLLPGMDVTVHIHKR